MMGSLETQYLIWKTAHAELTHEAEQRRRVHEAMQGSWGTSRRAARALELGQRLRWLSLGRRPL